MVTWDISGYILEVEKHLNNKQVYEEVKFSENILNSFVEKRYLI